jgi:3-(3-hydroxy-phenyl)propionate hydroxylase
LTSDIAILGYGPVGATLAALLSAHGRSVTVIEQSPAIYDKPRAITLDHEALRVMQAIGVGDAIRPFLAPHTGTDFLGIEGQLIRRFDPMPPPFPLGWWPTACFIQPRLEAVLRARVEAIGTAKILLGHQATAIAQNADGVTLTVRDAIGAESRIAAKYLLACDGANSFARKQLGIGVEDLAFDEWWMVVDTRVRDDSGLPKKSTQYCQPSRPSTFVRGPLDLRRWEIKLLPGEDPAEFGRPENVQKLIGRHADLSKLEIWRSAVYRFHAIVADEWRKGRVFLLGDACHQMPPFLGQGLCGGIRDVVNLAWKLEMALDGIARDDLLDSYEAERKPHIRAVVAHAKEFGEVVGELDPIRARERDRRLEASITRGESETVRQKYIPDLAHGAIDKANGGGALFPQPRVTAADGKETLLDDALFPRNERPRFLLATLDDSAQNWMSPASAAIWNKLHGQHAVIASGANSSSASVPHFVERDGLFASFMRQHGAAVAIVRPDRAVYALARDADSLNAAIARLGAQILF